MLRVLIATESPLAADELRRDLQDAGVEIVAENSKVAELAAAAVRSEPDLVIAASTSPSGILFDAAQMLSTLAPCPFVMFTSDPDASKIEKASASGIHAYIVNGYAKHRLLSIMQVARARFRHEQLLKEELGGLSQRFEERKIVDRAKGVLMRSRGVTEEEAFELLRSLAMNSRQRMGVVAQGVIDMSRASEAVNRAGQLRMLSQRIVKCYVQRVFGLDIDQACEMTSDCIDRVEANLGILRKAISGKGYGDLVERVAASWTEVRAICAETPDGTRIDDLDTRADHMLKDAERLTEFLESSGLVPSLRILNTSGRQRMLSQRIAKLCFMLAIDPTPARMVQLRELTGGFQAAVDYLGASPLSTVAIRSSLEWALKEWQKLHGLLESISDKDVLPEVSAASERLLDASERLTDDYEQAMQILIGDRLGRLT